MASFVAIITAIGSIVGALLYFYKAVKATPEQKKEEADKTTQEEKESFEKTGRPS